MKILTTIAVFYVAYCCLLFFLQRRIVFPRGMVPPPAEETRPSTLERIWIDTSYGKVETWFLPPDVQAGEKSAPAVIFAHGNAELIDFWPHELKAFNSLGVGLLLVEYPGYGRSAGKPSEQTVLEAFVGAYDALVSRRDVDSSRIVLLGRSLGGGAVCALAGQRPSAALILMSSFTSVRSLATKFLVPGFFVQDPFDNLTIVKDYPNPILVIHGRGDNIIPYSHGLALHRAARQGEMITYECQHNDCPPNWRVFWQDMASFLRKADIIPEGNKETGA